MKLISELKYREDIRKNVYIAKITGVHKRFKYEREFLDKTETQEGNQIIYEWELEECGYYEWHEDNNIEKQRGYFWFNVEEEEIEYADEQEINRAIARKI